MRLPAWIGKRARPILFGVGGILVAGGLLAFQRRPVEVSMQRVEVGDVVLDAAGTGTVESEAVVQVAFTVAGRLATLTAGEGDVVRAEQVLGTLDVTGAERERKVAVASATLAAAAIARADADIARAVAVRQAADKDLERARSLQASGAIHGAELDAATERLARAEAELAAARAARSQGHGGVSVARETIALHERRVGDGVLRSPIDGVVLKRHHEPGDVLGGGAVVLTIASTRKLWARVWVDESALASLRPGADARVSLRGGDGRALGARVDRIAPEADRQTHEVLVDLELLERPRGLVFGQRVDALVTLDRRRDVARVARTACNPTEGPCLVARDGRLAEVVVRSGLTGNEAVEILGGLAAGDEIVDRSSFVGAPPLGRAVRRRGQ